MAAMDGRFSVSLDDIRKVAIPVLRHRISTNFQAQAEGKTTETPHQAAPGRGPASPKSPKYDRRERPDRLDAEVTDLARPRAATSNASSRAGRPERAGEVDPWPAPPRNT